jgi:hypothetical protein
MSMKHEVLEIKYENAVRVSILVLVFRSAGLPTGLPS